MSRADGQLLKMAEQISANVGARLSSQAAAAKTVEHINRFWTVDMKHRLVEAVRLDSSDLSDVLLLVAESLGEIA